MYTSPVVLDKLGVVFWKMMFYHFIRHLFGTTNMRMSPQPKDDW